MEERDPPPHTHTPRGRQVNWKKACQEGLTTEYAMRVDAIVRPLLGLQYSSVEDLSQEIDVVASKMEQAAFATLPLVTSRKPNENLYIKDEALQDISRKSSTARRRWEDAGKPREGPLFERKKSLKKEVRAM